MAGPSGAGKAASRYPFGSRPLAALLPGVTGAAFRHHSPATGRLCADWTEIVGPALAAVTAPGHCRDGVLRISCSGPVALELQHLAPALIERIDRHFGSPFVERLVFRQVRQARPARPPETPQAVDEAALGARLSGIREGPLREAFLRLGRAMQQAPKRR